LRSSAGQQLVETDAPGDGEGGKDVAMRQRAADLEAIAADRKSACNCASILPACSYDSALWRLALAWILVPSSATVPSFSTPISRATPSTCTNSPSISFRKRRLNAAIVS
jgi:hypothetical protein